MIARLNATLKTAFVTSILAALDAGAAEARIDIYSGTMPATPDTAITSQTLLAELVCSDPSGLVASNMLTFDSITQDASANNTGTATWARLRPSTGGAVLDIDVGATGSGAALQLNTTAIVAGGPVIVTSLTVAFA